MKLQITLLLSLVTLVSVNAQEIKAPIDYLNYISKETELVSKSTWKYTSAVAHSKSARKIDNTRKALIKTIQASQKKIAALKDGYKGDIEYRDQIITYLKISENQINNEYDKIIDMQEVADQSYDYMEAYIMTRDLVNKKINEEVDKLNENQKKFADKYGIKISNEETELSKKMKISNEVFENHTQLFLIFFKASITEVSLMKAIEANDLNAIQQNAGALDKYAAEGLDKLKTFIAYKKDPILVNATKKYMEFCKKEAMEYVPAVEANLMLNQKFAESKKTLESKPEASRSKEEINNYNKMIVQVNKSIDSYNKINTKYNGERNVNITNWNSTADFFISKHVPTN